MESKILAADLNDLCPVLEHRFAPPRRWRFDVAFPHKMLAVEIEGGAWVNGRHTRGAGFIKDMEKYNAATLLGWRLLRYTPEQVKSGMASTQIRQMMGAL